ncbi:F0F1 ATP synthase subunit A [Candidatus Nomurabacteria bacterium]|nr:F0F1 ATP synthase subunit A [Candidatus Nomurabacteria bacterium]
MIFQVPAAQPTVQPEVVLSLGSLGVTNAMLTGIVVSVLFIIFAIWARTSAKLLAGKFQTAVEMMFETFVDLLESITGNKTAAQKLLPLIGTLFLFMGLSNLIALIPGLTSITYDGISVFRTPTNDFNMTFSIALAMVILTQIASLKEFGLFGHLGKYFKFKDVIAGFKQGIGAGFLAIIDFLIGLLDIVSEIAKVVSLSLRLFGNMYAGDVLAAILLGAFALFIPAPWLAMNLLVGVLQALVFGALTAAYYALAVERAEEQQIV